MTFASTGLTTGAWPPSPVVSRVRVPPVIAMRYAWRVNGEGSLVTRWKCTLSAARSTCSTSQLPLVSATLAEPSGLAA